MVSMSLPCKSFSYFTNEYGTSNVYNCSNRNAGSCQKSSKCEVCPSHTLQLLHQRIWYTKRVWLFLPKCWILSKIVKAWVGWCNCECSYELHSAVFVQASSNSPKNMARQMCIIVLTKTLDPVKNRPRVMLLMLLWVQYNGSISTNYKIWTESLRVRSKYQTLYTTEYMKCHSKTGYGRCFWSTLIITANHYYCQPLLMSVKWLEYCWALMAPFHQVCHSRNADSRKPIVELDAVS